MGSCRVRARPRHTAWAKHPVRDARRGFIPTLARATPRGLCMALERLLRRVPVGVAPNQGT